MAGYAKGERLPQASCSPVSPANLLGLATADEGIKEGLVYLGEAGEERV